MRKLVSGPVFIGGQSYGGGGETPAGARMIYSEYPCYSPIYCASAVGYFMESIYRHGGTEPTVIETKCQTLGDPTCTYDMTWR